MISTLAQTTLVFIEEAQAHDVSVAAGPVNLLTDVPCIHATRIDVTINATVAGTVSVVMYSASKALIITTALGAVAAGTTVGYEFGTTPPQTIGQTYDVIYTPTAPAPADTATVWTAARS
jgi:hypothetical protein